MSGHIAWEYLSDLEKAQLLHFYPELKEEKDVGKSETR